MCDIKTVGILIAKRIQTLKDPAADQASSSDSLQTSQVSRRKPSMGAMRQLFGGLAAHVHGTLNASSWLMPPTARLAKLPLLG